MPAITATKVNAAGTNAITLTTLDGATDSLVYDESKTQVLVLQNATAGALTPVIDGAGGTTVNAPGVGSVDVSAGYSVGSIAAGAQKAIVLSTISAYLQGVIAITGGTGIVAMLLEI